MPMPDLQAEPPAGALSADAAALLDNPIWHALGTEHNAIALGHGQALRYPSHIGPLSGVPAQNPENYTALAALAPGDIAVLFSLESFRFPAGWTVIRAFELVQMVRTHCPLDRPEILSQAMRPLTPADAPAMVSLAELTEPGPFRLRTLELGGFYGIFERDRLVSMAGRRLHLPGFTEVSGVCTHPDARGRGYAALLMSRVIREIEHEGKTAFLHAMAQNPAIRLYQHLGFTLRQTFHGIVLKPNPDPAA